MMKKIWVLLLGLFLCTGVARAQPADDLLKRLDQQANNFKDANFHFKMRIKNAEGVREIEFSSLQKGTQKRLVRFLAPGDIKGMGMLMESADTMYALLPGFNNRVRRMGMHAKNQSFFGSDLASEDLSAIEFGPVYSAKRAGTEGEQVLLELAVKPGQQSEFPRLKMWVDEKRAVISKIEYYDAAGKKLRTQRREDFRKDEASGFYGPYKLVFIDHRKGDHETELVLVKAAFNTNLQDSEFTVRALQK